jgi:chemotaxis protein MotA
MDPGTFAGIIIALVCIFGSMIMEGGKPAALIAPGPIMLVFGGTFGVAMASGLMKDATGMAKFLKGALLTKKHDSNESIAQLVSFAERARREGLLALEEAAKSVDDPFLKKGLELAVDGTDPEELHDILENEIHSMKARHKVGIKFMENMGGFAPTLGIIGTVLGLVHVLENLSDPSKLGPLISGAFIATLWGVMSANIFWLPMGNKLKRVSDIESNHRELLLEGILAIQAGANPRVIEQKLLTYLAPKEREALDKSKAA